MNRTFLELRKQFLQWRSLTPARMMRYVEDSRTRFANAPDPSPRARRGVGRDLAVDGHR